MIVQRANGRTVSWFDGSAPSQAATLASLAQPGVEVAINPRRNRARRSTIQSLVFDRNVFTPATARAWAKRHGFRAPKVDQTKNVLRIRQAEPSRFRTFRTIKIRAGVNAVLGLT
jgi:hypothetical protein